MTVGELIPIQDGELLAKVKEGLNISGNDYQNNTILVWINAVKQDLLFAGVSEEVLGSTLAVGCITRGVDDYWYSHRGEYTDLFWQGAERLRSTKTENGEGTLSYSLKASIVKNNFKVVAETDTLNIGIKGYDSRKDELQLFVNGFKFDSNRYSVISNEIIKLALPVLPNTAIEIIVIKLEV